MNPQIRKLEYRDIDRVYDLGMRVPEFSAKDKEEHKFWPKETLERFANQGLSFVTEDEGLVVGFLLSAYQPVTQKLTWENMYIEPNYQRRGASVIKRNDRLCNAGATECLGIATAIYIVIWLGNCSFRRALRECNT